MIYIFNKCEFCFILFYWVFLVLGAEDSKANKKQRKIEGSANFADTI